MAFAYKDNGNTQVRANDLSSIKTKAKDLLERTGKSILCDALRYVELSSA